MAASAEGWQGRHERAAPPRSRQPARQVPQQSGWCPQGKDLGVNSGLTDIKSHGK